MQNPPDSPLSQRLNQIALRWASDHFDEHAGLVLFEHPQNGHMSGQGAHLLRESCYYAYALLRGGGENDLRRAETILGHVLTKQNLDENSRFWACFTCEYEQDWATWASPDQNWAQFQGMIFAYILALDDERRRLAAALRDQLDAAFRLTVRATLRRDVGAAYTNIALLSAGVAAAGASLRGMDGAEEFAHRKLSEVLARAEPSGAFDEYLSPTYYGTDFYALYSAERFAGTERTRALAGRLIDLAWDDVEAAYHPPTGQLGGPHSRAYGDNMLEYAAALKYYLALATDGKYPLKDLETAHSHDSSAAAIMCTHRVERRLDADAPRPASFRRVVLPITEGKPPEILTQYQDEHFSLGTINDQDLWTQRRNLIAYWRAEPGGPIGFVKSAWPGLDGGLWKGRFYGAQSGRCALVALRVPAASEPVAAFSHVLEFDLLGEAAPNPEVPGGFVVTLPGLTADVRPIPLPGAAEPAITVENTDGGGVALTWRWQPQTGGEPYLAAFLVSFTPAGLHPADLGELSVRGESGAFAIGASVDGEGLDLWLPTHP